MDGTSHKSQVMNGIIIRVCVCVCVGGGGEQFLHDFTSMTLLMSKNDIYEQYRVSKSWPSGYLMCEANI